MLTMFFQNLPSTAKVIFRTEEPSIRLLIRYLSFTAEWVLRNTVLLKYKLLVNIKFCVFKVDCKLYYIKTARIRETIEQFITITCVTFFVNIVFSTVFNTSSIIANTNNDHFKNKSQRFISFIYVFANNPLKYILWDHCFLNIYAIIQKYLKRISYAYKKLIS